MIRTMIAATIGGLMLAVPAAAANWRTPPQALRAAKLRGVEFLASKNWAQPVDGACVGVGTKHGTAARPTYRTFFCTLAFKSGTDARTVMVIDAVGYVGGRLEGGLVATKWRFQ